jgi:hypothetical protein
MNLIEAERLMTKLAAKFKASNYPFCDRRSFNYFGNAVDVPLMIIGFAEAMRRLRIAEEALAFYASGSTYLQPTVEVNDGHGLNYGRTVGKPPIEGTWGRAAENALQEIRSEAEI